MVVRIKYRAILTLLVLYAFAGAAFYYFVWAAANGERGLKAKSAYVADISRLSKELEALQTEHAALERRNAQLRPASIDRDLLEEQARIVLGRVAKNDVMIFLNKPSAN